MKELRISFPDYTPEEQERDVEHFKKLEKKYQPHVFILKVDGVCTLISSFQKAALFINFMTEKLV